MQVLESRTKLGSQISAPLLAMGCGVLLSASGVTPPAAAAYDLVLSSSFNLIGVDTFLLVLLNNVLLA